jgi:hypothetical protein
MLLRSEPAAASRGGIDRPASETKPARIGDVRIESAFPGKSESILAMPTAIANHLRRRCLHPRSEMAHGERNGGQSAHESMTSRFVSRRRSRAIFLWRRPAIMVAATSTGSLAVCPEVRLSAQIVDKCGANHPLRDSPPRKARLQRARRGKPWTWSPTCQRAFERIVPKGDYPFKRWTNAARIIDGAISRDQSITAALRMHTIVACAGVDVRLRMRCGRSPRYRNVSPA